MSSADEMVMIIRRDDNGGLFLISDKLERSRAESLKFVMEMRGHKQTYELISYRPDERDRIIADMNINL